MTDLSAVSPASNANDLPVHLIDIYPEANVILFGGPPWLPADRRIIHVDNTSDKVKLQLGNHYDHFHPTAEVRRFGNRELHVFSWADRTYVAE